MTEFILILYIYTGAFSAYEAIGLTTIDQFQTQSNCEKAGKEAEKLVAGTHKVVNFVCVERVHK